MPPKIIDTHVHVWDLERAEYAWLKGDETIINRTYSIEELSDERIKAEVTEGVIVQAANNFEDTDSMLEVAEKNDWIKGIVGWVPLQNPEQTETALTGKYLSNKYYKGVRHLIHNEPDNKWLLQDEVIESLKIIAHNNLSYDVVGIIPEHIETVIEVGEKVPGLRLVFDHINQPPIAAKEKFGRWGSLMSEAAKNPNFYIKISGLGTTSKKIDWTAEDLKPYVAFAIEEYGTDRCFCGSDWPVSLLAGSYVNTWKAYQTIITDLFDYNDQEKIFHKNAEKFYSLQ